MALPLILALEKKGFIIIASVASPEAVDELERAGKGYVRALVLDPFEVRLCFTRKLKHPFHTMMHDSLPRFPSSFAPWPLRYPIDSPSISMEIRTPPPQPIPSCTLSFPSSASPNSPLSPHWNTSSSRANTSSTSTPRTSPPSRSSRRSCPSCATLPRARATPSETAGGRRASSCVFRRSTRVSGCLSWDRVR